MTRILLTIVATLGLLASIPGQGRAHEIRPTIVTANFAADGQFQIEINTNMEALLAGIGPQHKDSNESPGAALYNQLRTLPPREFDAKIREFMPRWLEGMRIEFDGTRVVPRVTLIDAPAVGDTDLARISTIQLAGTAPVGARTFRWQYAPEFGSSVIRVRQAGSDQLTASWLKDGKASDPIPLAGAKPKSTLELFADYATLGFTHILPFGIDHILFVLGLYLLSTNLRPLLIQVTAFTIAHSITLGLGLYGVIEVSPKIVEPLIAASIVYVAVENILTNKLHAWRPLIVFGFGLLHGLGFAGVLHEIGLPRSDYVTGLIAFNIGVEFGQLAVIALAFAATGLWFRTRPWYRARIVIPASVMIAAVGLFWTVERVIAG